MATLNSTRVEAIYTDGACSGNPGPGGWGTVLYFSDDRRHELGGAAPNTTNNRMEIQAAIAALEALAALEQREPTTLYTDSQYVQNGITKWIHGWKKKGWKTAGGKPVLNQDLWEALDRVHQQVNAQLAAPLKWTYVRGHSGNAGNDRCDAIARAFATGEQPKLVQTGALSASTSPQAAPASAELLPKSPPKSMTPKSSTASSPDLDPALSIEAALTKLRAADELAQQGYLITAAELTALTGVSEAAIAQRGEAWTWRNWEVSQAQLQGTTQPDGDRFWQLSRID